MILVMIGTENAPQVSCTMVYVGREDEKGKTAP
jgi:hypothetical protein